MSESSCLHGVIGPCAKCKEAGERYPGIKAWLRTDDKDKSSKK